MRDVLVYKNRFREYWTDQPDSYWFMRLMQEVGELADTFMEETQDDRAHELRQIASICLNWLDKRGEYVNDTS